MDEAGPLIKVLAILGVSGVCTLIVYCASALPGIAAEEEKNKTRIYLILGVMIVAVIGIFFLIYFLLSHKS